MILIPNVCYLHQFHAVLNINIKFKKYSYLFILDEHESETIKLNENGLYFISKSFLIYFK